MDERAVGRVPVEEPHVTARRLVHIWLESLVTQDPAAVDWQEIVNLRLVLSTMPRERSLALVRFMRHADREDLRWAAAALLVALSDNPHAEPDGAALESAREVVANCLTGRGGDTDKAKVKICGVLTEFGKAREFQLNILNLLHHEHPEVWVAAAQALWQFEPDLTGAHLYMFGMVIANQASQYPMWQMAFAGATMLQMGLREDLAIRRVEEYLALGFGERTQHLVSFLGFIGRKAMPLLPSIEELMNREEATWGQRAELARICCIIRGPESPEIAVEAIKSGQTSRIVGALHGMGTWGEVGDRCFEVLKEMFVVTDPEIRQLALRVAASDPALCCSKESLWKYLVEREDDVDCLDVLLEVVAIASRSNGGKLIDGWLLSGNRRTIEMGYRVLGSMGMEGVCKLLTECHERGLSELADYARSLARELVGDRGHVAGVIAAQYPNETIVETRRCYLDILVELGIDARSAADVVVTVAMDGNPGEVRRAKQVLQNIREATGAAIEARKVGAAPADQVALEMVSLESEQERALEFPHLEDLSDATLVRFAVACQLSNRGIHSFTAMASWMSRSADDFCIGWSRKSIETDFVDVEACVGQGRLNDRRPRSAGAVNDAGWRVYRDVVAILERRRVIWKIDDSKKG